MSQQYLSILLLFFISILFGFAPLVSNFIINFLINRKNPNKKISDLSCNVQLSTYECGFPTFSDARFKFPIKFALIAILFIIFEV